MGRADVFDFAVRGNVNWGTGFILRVSLDPDRPGCHVDGNVVECDRIGPGVHYAADLVAVPVEYEGEMRPGVRARAPVAGPRAG